MAQAVAGQGEAVGVAACEGSVAVGGVAVSAEGGAVDYNA